MSIVSVVYVTAAPTFDGPVGGFTTLGPAIGNQDPSAPAVSIASTSQEVLTSAPPKSSPSSAQTLKSQSTSIQTLPKSQSSELSSILTSSAQSSSDSLPDSSSVLSEQFTSTIPPASTSFLAASATQVSNTDSTAVPESPPHGMTNGDKAGLAIGIILALGALLLLGLFCYRRKKKQHDEADQMAEDEKSPFGGHGAAFAAAREPSLRSTRTASTAPRLSLRPVTQFLPLMTTDATRGNALGIDSIGSNSNAPQAKGAADNSIVQNQANNPANPFGNHAETSDHFPQAVPMLGSSPPAAQVPAPLSIRPSTPDAATLAAGTSLAVGAVGASAQHRNGPGPTTTSADRHVTHGPPYPMEGAMPSPAGTEFSMNSISSGAAATGPPPTNVHRVQLDFMPSMEDEIELRAGQLVRLLHEYDDGWVSLLPSSTDPISTAAKTRVRRFASALTALSKAWLPVHVSQPVPLSLALPVMDVDLHRVDHLRRVCAVHHNSDLPRPLAAVARLPLTAELLDRCHLDPSTVNAPCPLAHTAVVLSSARTFLHQPPGGGATLRLKFARGETVHPARAA